MDPKDVVEAFTSVARPLMLEYLDGPSQCIACVRITEQVLGRFGIAVRPVPVSMVVQCSEKRVAFVAGFDKRVRKAMRAKATAWAKRAARTGSGWEGHLICIAGDRWLIDPTLDQASAPHLGFVIPPDDMLCFDVREQLQSVSIEHMATDLRIVTANGLDLHIQYFPLADRSFYETPAWELDHIGPAIRAITREMEKRPALIAQERL
jgi:hypothetical protein